MPTSNEFSPQLPGMNTRQVGSFLDTLPDSYKTVVPPAHKRSIYSGAQSPFPWTSRMPEGMTKAQAIGAIPSGNYTPGQDGVGEASGMSVNDIYGQMQTANQSMLDAGSKPLYTDKQMGIGLAPGANDWMYDNSLPRPHEQNQSGGNYGGPGQQGGGSYGAPSQAPLSWQNQGASGGQSQLGALPMGNQSSGQSPGIASLNQALAGYKANPPPNQGPTMTATTGNSNLYSDGSMNSTQTPGLSSTQPVMTPERMAFNAWNPQPTPGLSSTQPYPSDNPTPPSYGSYTQLQPQTPGYSSTQPVTQPASRTYGG
jgi:hypothetical protein